MACAGPSPAVTSAEIAVASSSAEHGANACVFAPLLSHFGGGVYRCLGFDTAGEMAAVGVPTALRGKRAVVCRDCCCGCFGCWWDTRCWSPSPVGDTTVNSSCAWWGKSVPDIVDDDGRGPCDSDGCSGSSRRSLCTAWIGCIFMISASCSYSCWCWCCPRLPPPPPPPPFFSVARASWYNCCSVGVAGENFGSLIGVSAGEPPPPSPTSLVSRCRPALPPAGEEIGGVSPKGGTRAWPCPGA